MISYTYYVPAPSDVFPPDFWEDVANEIMSQNPGMTSEEAWYITNLIAAMVAQDPEGFMEVVRSYMSPSVQSPVSNVFMSIGMPSLGIGAGFGLGIDTGIHVPIEPYAGWVCPNVLKKAAQVATNVGKWLLDQTVKVGRATGQWISNKVPAIFGGGSAMSNLDTAKQTLARVTNDSTITLRSETAGNFRHNLIQLTNQTGAGMRAHHTLPRQFEADFVRAFSGTGLNIHHPMFGSWIPTATHQSYQWHRSYNEAWEVFFNIANNPTAEQVLKLVRELAPLFNFTLNW